MNLTQIIKEQLEEACGCSKEGCGARHLSPGESVANADRIKVDPKTGKKVDPIKKRNDEIEKLRQQLYADREE